MPATGFPIVLVAPAHERELPLAFAAKGKRCKYSIASPCWIRDPIGSDRDVDDAPSLFLRLRLTFETSSHTQPRCYLATSELFPLANVPRDVPSYLAENLPCFRLTAFHLLFDVLREF